MTEEQEQLFELMQRWDRYLSELKDVFNETLVAAEPHFLKITTEETGNEQKLLVSWLALGIHLNELLAKILKTWESAMGPGMRSIALADVQLGYHWNNERRKGERAEWELRLMFEQRENNIVGKFADTSYQRLLASGELWFNCSCCNHTIAVNTDVFRSHKVICDHCNTYNIYMVSAKVKSLEWLVLNYLPPYRCIKEKELLNACNGELLHTVGPIRQNLVQQSEIAQNTYVTKLLGIRNEIIPELKKQYENDYLILMKKYTEPLTQYTGSRVSENPFHMQPKQTLLPT